jgi:glucose/mannose-6-phosphate isomerase
MNSINKSYTDAQIKALNSIDNMPNHLRLPYGNDMRNALTQADGQGINNIIFCGMGGSALAGNIAKNWLFNRLNVPLEVVRGSSLPGYVDEHSLVIISSYSGDTAETLEAYEQASKNNVQIIVLTRGGELKERAKADNRIILDLPDCSQPRFALFASLRALACTLANMGLITNIDVERELEDTADFLDTQEMMLSPDIDSSNIAKDLAILLAGKQVIVYASPQLASAAYVWKISINENAKQLAWYNTYSELDHNELEGWMFPEQKNIIGLALNSKFETEHMQKRIEITTKLIGQKDVKFETPQIVGSTQIQELLFACLLGNYCAAYIAVENNIDPEEVKVISKLKLDLK